MNQKLVSYQNQQISSMYHAASMPYMHVVMF